MGWCGFEVVGEVVVRGEELRMLCGFEEMGGEVCGRERLGLWGWKSGEEFVLGSKK